MLEQQLFTSLKGLSEEVFVQRAYLALLGRPADPTGYRDNLARLRAAVPREQVWDDLANSEESTLFRNRGAPARQPAPAPAPAAQPAPADAVRSVQELLDKDGAELVRAAYWAILGREADPSGLAHYTQRLAAGDSKVEILLALRRDPEGKAFGARLEGLDGLVEPVRAPSPPVQIAHVNDLFGFHGEAFLRAAYLAILKREIDTDGLKLYLDVLSAGRSRSYVLAELAASAEARSKAAELPGLERMLAAYRRAQKPTWSGWYWRNVKGAESDSRSACELRMLAYATLAR